MAAATAGCMTGTDDEYIWQLPDTTGLNTRSSWSAGERIRQRHPPDRSKTGAGL